jgi:hypothetical protein
MERMEEVMKARLGEAFQLYALFVVAVSCLLLLCAAPRPLVPEALPTLRLPEDAVRVVLAQDAIDAQHAPTSPAAMELERLFLEHGEAEDGTATSAAPTAARARALATAFTQLVKEEGALAGIRMRARELSKLEAALALSLPEEQVKGVMGVFPNALDVHGVTRDGLEVAPQLVLRTLYKVRFNLIVDQAPDFSLSEVERMAYQGWIALHAEALPVERRLRALGAYAKVAGPGSTSHVKEAEGVLLYRAERYPEALRALTEARTRTGSIRLRNYALGAELALAEADSAGNP